MMASAAHSLGSHTESGVRSAAMKSTRLVKPSGLTICSGRSRRNSTTTPAAAKSAMQRQQVAGAARGEDVHERPG